MVLNHVALAGIVFATADLAMTSAPSSRIHQHLSFKPPFNEVDHFGERFVGSDWDSGGSTKVMKNFLRLTPDKQSKRGSLWSVREIGDDMFSAVLEFRISGRGERFFGDGLAFWMVEPPESHQVRDQHYDRNHYYEGMSGWVDDDTYFGYRRVEFPTGDYHGFTETFTGVGVIVDTYRNEEFYSKHKDITIVVNNGTMTVEEMMSEAKGCNAHVRYYENRDDFEAATLSSRLKVEVENGKMSVEIDYKNTGQWVECAEVILPPMDKGWVKSSHIGLTASTGELSDNHDVLRLDTFVSSNDAQIGENEPKSQSAVQVEPDSPMEERVALLETMVNALLIKLELMDHHQEHNVAKVDEHMMELFEKLAANEKTLRTTVVSTEVKVEQLEKKVSDHVETRLESGLGEAALMSRGWKMPFAVLVIGLVAAGVWCYRLYQHLRKSHLL